MLGRDKQPESAVAPAQHPGRDSAFQQEGDAVGAQGATRERILGISPANLLCAFAGCHNEPANGDGEADDESPLIDELLAFSSKGISPVFQNSADTPLHLEGPALNTSGSRLDPSPRPDDGVGNSQGTRGMRPGSLLLHIKQPPNLYAERPVVLEDDESDTPEPVPAAVFVSADAGTDPASELSKGPWWDVEDECHVDDDLRPISLLEQEGLASTPVLAQPHPHHDPPGSSQGQISQHGVGIGGAPDEAALPTLPQSLSENGGGGSDENASELGRDMQLVVEEQEMSSSAPAPGSLHPRRTSAEPPHPHTEQEHDRGGASRGRPEELGRGPPCRSQDRGEEAQEQQQRQEVAVELMRGDDGGDREEPGERGEQRRQPDETEIGSDIQHPEASDCSIGGEDDDDPRPAKRRRLPSTENALTLPDEPAPVTNNDHHPSRTSQSPSVTLESAPVAEFQEWPFEGFLKRVKIGNKTIYNLEFQLPHVQEHLHSEALCMRSDKETTAEAATPRDANAHSKMHPPAAVRPRIKRAPWRPEEDATVLKKKDEDGCTWEEIGEALHRTPLAIKVQYSKMIRAGVGEADVSGGQQQKRRRGRPRKSHLSVNSAC
jgi:hypothetical protein